MRGRSKYHHRYTRDVYAGCMQRTAGPRQLAPRHERKLLRSARDAASSAIAWRRIATMCPICGRPNVSRAALVEHLRKLHGAA